MSGSRTLKLSILADVDNLKKNLDTGSKEVEGFGGKLEKFGKVAAAAFAAAAAAAAAYAGKLAIEGVKAAIEDEAAQNRLANALSSGPLPSNFCKTGARLAPYSKQCGPMLKHHLTQHLQYLLQLQQAQYSPSMYYQSSHLPEELLPEHLPTLGR